MSSAGRWVYRYRGRGWNSRLVGEVCGVRRVTGGLVVVEAIAGLIAKFWLGGWMTHGRKFVWLLLLRARLACLFPTGWPRPSAREPWLVQALSS